MDNEGLERLLISASEAERRLEKALEEAKSMNLD